jgi:hypothetical protein
MFRDEEWCELRGKRYIVVKVFFAYFLADKGENHTVPYNRR